MAASLFDQAAAAAAFLRQQAPSVTPQIGLVLGSGLGAVADILTRATRVPYAAIPHFPQSTVAGHSGQLHLGTLDGVGVAILQGRVHFYEGYTAQQVTFPTRVLGLLGVDTLILTNAAGGIRPGLRVGQLMLLADHINFLGFNPLVGPNEPRFATHPGSGQRFFDMTTAYDPELRALARRVAAAQQLPLDEAVYLAVSGPSFETPAEIRAFQRLGADLVGMSTVPETLVARHMGLRVVGLSCVTNLAAGLSDSALSHEEVFAAGRSVETQLARLLTELIPQIARTQIARTLPGAAQPHPQAPAS